MTVATRRFHATAASGSCRRRAATTVAPAATLGAVSVALLALVATCAPGAWAADPTTYRLGAMLTMGVNALLPYPVSYQVFDMAVRELNASGVLSNGDSLYAYPLNLTGSTAFFKSLEAASYLKDKALFPAADIVLGPSFSRDTTVAAGVLQTSAIPNISPSATASELSDNALYPYFARTITSNAIEARGLAFLCYQMNWKKVGLIATSDGFGSSLVEAYSVAAKGLGVNVVTTQAFATGSVDPERILNLVSLIKDSGVWVVCLFVTGVDYTAVLAALRALDMDKPPYTLVYTTSISSNLPAGAVGFDVFVNETTPEFVSYAARAAAFTGGRSLGGYSTHLMYDATYLAGYALAKYSAIRASCPTYPATPVFSPPLPSTICSQYATMSRGALLFQLILSTTFVGVSGPVSLDANGDRMGKFWITNSRNLTLSPVRVGVLDLGGSQPVPGVSSASFTAAPVFADGTTVVPLDRYRPRVGDTIEDDINGSYWVLSYGICVLGAWTALILIEQAVWNYGHVPLLSTLGWTLASSTALAIGLWSALVIGLTAPSFAALPDSTLSYKALNVFASLLIAWPCCFVAFALMIPTLRARNVPRTNNSELEGMSRMDTDTAAASGIEASGTQQMDADTAVATVKALNEAKIAAAQERKANRCVKYSKQALPWMLGAFALNAGVVGVHFTIWNSLELALDRRLQPGITAAGILVAFVFGAIALAMYFHYRTSRFRWVSAFVMAVAITGAHFTFLGGAMYTYNGRDDLTHDLKASIMQIVAAVLTCLACFVFIGLNVIRLRLSKDVLDRFLLQAQKKIRALEVVAQHRDHMLTERDTLLQLIATVRPMVRANHPLLLQLVKEYGPNRRQPQPLDDANDEAADVVGLPEGVHAAFASAPQPMPQGQGQGNSQLVQRSITRSAAGGSQKDLDKASAAPTTAGGASGGRSSPGPSASSPQNVIGTMNRTASGVAAAGGTRSSVTYTVAGATDAPATMRGNLELASRPLASTGGFVMNTDSPVVHGSSIHPQVVGSGGTPLLAHAQLSVHPSGSGDDSAPGAVPSNGPSGPRNSVSVSRGSAFAKYAVAPVAPVAAAAELAIDVLPYAVGDATGYGPGGPAGPESGGGSGGRPGSAPKHDGKEGGSPKTSHNQLTVASGGAPASHSRDRNDSKDNGPGGAPRGIGRATRAPPPTGLLGSDAHPDTRPNLSPAAAAAAQLPAPAKPPSFAEIMSNPVCLEIFKDAVAANHNSENVSFLLDVERYRQSADDQDDPAAPERRRVLALDIAATYFGVPATMLSLDRASSTPGGPFIPAPHAVNVAATVRDQVLEDIRKERFTPKLFDTPFHEVRRLLERNDFARFVESPQYAVCGALLVISAQLQDRLALGAALPRGKAAEILENSILRGKPGGRIKSSNLFSGGSSGASNPSSGQTTAMAADAVATGGAAVTPFKTK